MQTERYRYRSPAKRLRQERGWSQLEVAEAIGVSNSMISRFERGLAVPSGDNLLALAELFGVTPYELMDRPAEVAAP